MRVIWVEHWTASRDHAGDIASALNRYIAIPNSVPKQNGNLNGSEVDLPGSRDQRYIHCRTRCTLPARLFEARDESSHDLRILKQCSIWFRQHRRHPVTGPRSAAAYGAQVKPKQSAQ